MTIEDVFQGIVAKVMDGRIVLSCSPIDGPLCAYENWLTWRIARDSELLARKKMYAAQPSESNNRSWI